MIKRYEMPVTAWTIRYVRIYHLHMNMTCGTNLDKIVYWYLRAQIFKLRNTFNLQKL